ncbi:MAG: recombinase family protein [Ardenticatenales bacterium]|nr:recombinase family protein [Ardenticatenales bacterium]
MLIGYARVSTEDQNLDLQVDALTKAGCDRIFEDRLSGAVAQRPGLAEAIAFAREGDTLVVWRLDRLGRSLKNLIEVVGSLEDRGIGLKSLQEAIDTSSSSGRLVFQIFGALAEFERNLIRERTMAGLAAARARGKQGGRPMKLDEAKVKLLYDLYDERKRPIAEICRLVGIAKPTLYEYLRRRAG